MLYLFSVLLAVAVLTLLVVFAAIKGNAMHIVGYSIFGSGLVLFYIVRSLLVHSKSEAWKSVLQKLDHVMIYIMIAATYTPVSFLLPDRAWGWSLFGVTWGLVFFASTLRWTELVSSFYVTCGLYVGLLTLDTVAFHEVHGFLSPIATLWFTLGGLAYTAETVLVILRPPLGVKTLSPSYHDERVYENIALPFVICGSLCHFWAFMQLL